MKIYNDDEIWIGVVSCRVIDAHLWAATEECTAINSIRADWHIYALPTQSIFGSNKGLSPVRHQAIIWPKAVVLSIGPLGTNFSKNVFEINSNT